MDRLLKKYFEKKGYTYEKLAELETPASQPLMDTEKLCRNLKEIHDKQLHLVLIPDFDCDGIMSGLVGFTGFKELSFNVNLFVCDPKDGYGFTANTIDIIHKTMPDTYAILTSDTGITCADGIARAKELGMKVFVTDHHQEDANLHTGADIVVDPCRVDETYPLKTICGAYVIFKVISAYAHMYCDTEEQDRIDRLRVFAGIGTVSDSMSLVHENRGLARDAVRIARLVWNNGSDFYVSSLTGSSTYVSAFRGLFELLCISFASGQIHYPDDIDESYFGFIVAPMMNSLKRLNLKATTAYKVFFPADDAERKQAVEILQQANQKRKTVVSMCENVIDQTEQPYAPYIYLTEAHPGILGLVASKKLNTAKNPVLVLQENEDGSYSGSGRSPVWYNALSRLKQGGFKAAGHEYAFGFQADNLDGVKKAYQFLKDDVSLLLQFIKPAEAEPDIIISTLGDGDTDIDIPLLYEFMNDLHVYGPFGVGFEAPVTALKFKKDDFDWRTMSAGQHMRGTRGGFQLLIWNYKDTPFKDKDEITITGKLGINTFQGTSHMQYIAENFV